MIKARNVLLITNAIVTSVSLIRLDTKASDVNHASVKRPAMSPADSTKTAAARCVLVGVHLSRFVVDRFKISMTLKI